MNWRSDLINNEDYGVKGLFMQFQAGQPMAGDPIEITTIADRFTLPAKTTPEKLPMVSFGYGASRPLEGGTTEGEREEFSIIVHATVNASEDKELIERAGDMHECVELIAKSLRTFSTERVYIENARVSADTGEGMLSEKEYMLFRIGLICEVYGD